VFYVADSLFQSGSFHESALEYERIVFKQTGNIQTVEALIGKAKCYIQLKDCKKALTEFKRIQFRGLNDTLQYRVRYEIALCSYLSGDVAEAKSQFEQMRFYFRDSTIMYPTLVLQILTNNELYNWQEAYSNALFYIQLNVQDSLVADSLEETLRSFYNSKRIPKLRNPDKARLLSTFIPGAGQMYAGYPLEGLLNFTLQVLSLAGGIYGIYTHYYFTGYVIGFGLFQKFYFGGINRAFRLAEKKNYQEVRKFNEMVKEFVLSIH
jgi:TM2 domain-containing membrane protein YozV